jgi:integral membrane sensor domain MASE1
MARLGPSKRWRDAALTAALVGGYAASVLFSFLMSRLGGQTASIWTATGFLAAALILLDGRWRIGAAAACVLFQTLASLAVGDGPARALANPPVNLLEAAIAAWAAIRFCGARTRRLSLRKLSLLILAAIAPATMLGAVIGAVVNAVLFGQDLVTGWLSWAVPTSLGMAIVLPGVLIMVRETQYTEFRRSPIEVVGLLAGVCGLASAVYYQSQIPLQFTVFPALTLVAFRLGPPGASVASFLVGIISLSLVTLGRGPAMLSTALDGFQRVRLTEAVVAAALFTSLVTAGALADQARLRRLVMNRDKAVRAARARARDAERAGAAAAARSSRAPVRKDVVDFA